MNAYVEVEHKKSLNHEFQLQTLRCKHYKLSLSVTAQRMLFVSSACCWYDQPNLRYETNKLITHWGYVLLSSIPTT